MLTAEHPYASFVHRVEKPARYLGGEYNSVVKDWESAACRFALAFPDVYDIGMSHLGTKILYSLINRTPDLLMERCFAPWFDMEKELRERGLPLLSLENHRSLREFDVVGFSLQFEMTFTNILTMLDLGGIPLHSASRTLSDPLVIAGGPVATHPEPIGRFVDVILVGDAEERLPRLLRHWMELKRAGGRSREEMIAELAREGGLYAPALYTRRIEPRTGMLVVEGPRPEYPGVPATVERNLLEDISRYRFPSDSPVAVAEAIFDRMSVEIARGCTEGCRFCQAGMIYRPVRERDPDEVVETVLAAVDQGGYDEAALTALSTADYSCISPLVRKLMDRLRPEKVSLSISSLRAYGLSTDVLDEISSVKATGLTFAPEAGTQRMRDVINKNVSEADIFATAHRVFSRGWDKMKLYFIIGLPTEEDEDIAGIAQMGREAVEIGTQYRRAVTVTVSVSSHVPKPHTPFQWVAMDAIPGIERKQGLLWRMSRQYGFKFRKHDMWVSHIEGILARGDDRTGALLEAAWRRGARFDSWDEHLARDAWEGALAWWEETEGVSRQQFLGTLPVDARLPWDHIDVGLERGFLRREYQRAMAGRLSPPCSKPVGTQVHHTNVQDAVADQRMLVCYHCGVACDMTKMREDRVVALRKLGAEAPPEARGADNARGASLKRIRKGLTPHDFQQGKAFRYRVRFTKLGPVSLQGHLDLVRILPRVLRRAHLNAFFSEGFHPKPVMSFGPALELGAYALGEYVDIHLVDELAPEALLDRLNGASSEGLHFTAAARLSDTTPGLSKRVQAFDQLFVLLPDTLEALAGGQDVDAFLSARIAAFEAAASLPVTVRRKTGERTLDLRDIVARVSVGRSGDVALDAGIAAGRPALRVVQRFENGPTLKPSEIASALLGAPVTVHQVVRVSCAGLDDAGTLVDPLEGSAEDGRIARWTLGEARERQRRRPPVEEGEVGTTVNRSAALPLVPSEVPQLVAMARPD